MRATMFYIAFAAFLLNTARCAFTVDNDWILAEPYPFPTGICMQVSPDFENALFGIDIDPEWLKFVCEMDGSVTKYKWGLDGSNDCDVSTANITTFEYDNTTTVCTPGYFECDTPNNYLTMSAVVATSDAACDSPIITLLDPAYVTTNQCFCRSDGTFGKFACDTEQGILTEFSSLSDCESDTGGTESWTGNYDSCTFLVADADTGLDVFATMTDCVGTMIGGVTYSPTPDTEAPTEDPTPQPTDETESPTAIPTADPTATTDDSEDGPSAASNYVMICGVFVMFISVLIV